MNILILSWRGPKHPHEGGAEIVTHHYANSWVKAGYTVTLFTSNFRSGNREEVVDGVKVIRRGNAVGGVQVAFLFWYLFNTKEKFDLVIDQFHGIPFFTPLFVRTKKVAFIHEVAKEVWGLNPWPKPFNLIPKIIGQTLEPLLFKYLYQGIPFLTVSNSTKKELMDWNIPEKKITVIHNGVDVIPPLASTKKEKTPTIAFLGAIARDKGIEDALHAFSVVNKKYPRSQFWIIGKADFHYLTFLKELVEKLHIKNQVTFWGYVSQKEKFELLKRSHFVLNPSRREGWGLVVIESAAMGTPTIGYTVAGLKDSILDNKSGILCKLNTPENMAEHAIKLIEDEVLYKKLVNGAIEWSKEFKWEKSEKQSLKLLKEIYEQK